MLGRLLIWLFITNTAVSAGGKQTEIVVLKSPELRKLDRRSDIDQIALCKLQNSAVGAV